MYQVPTLDIIKERLTLIFPEGTDQRNLVIREMSAKTIFVMFYVDAIEGTGHWMRPSQVTMMNDAQASLTDKENRFLWNKNSLMSGKMKNISKPWYAANTREPIRDETIKNGLMILGALVERPGIPTSSPLPRYALSKSFAELFGDISEKELSLKIKEWRENNLSSGALMRVRLAKRTSSISSANILVSLPDGETRKLSPGPSSVLSKEVLEVFAKRFLSNPALVFLSESGNKVIAQDDSLAQSIGIKIQPDKHLPDIILADIGTKNPLIVFVEVVHSDGPITAERKKALLKLATNANFNEKHIVFVSVFADKDTAAFKKLCSQLAWGSFVWFASEPENILIYKGTEELEGKKLGDLI